MDGRFQQSGPGADAIAAGAPVARRYNDFVPAPSPASVPDPESFEDESDKGLHRADASRALATGLTYRPLADTVQATLELAETTDSAGLSPEREAGLLAAWEGR